MLSPVLLLTVYIHKEFPLDDEELRCRHGAETLVCGDEEEGTHPVRKTETVIQSKRWKKQKKLSDWKKTWSCICITVMLFGSVVKQTKGAHLKHSSQRVSDSFSQFVVSLSVTNMLIYFCFILDPFIPYLSSSCPHCIHALKPQFSARLSIVPSHHSGPAFVLLSLPALLDFLACFNYLPVKGTVWHFGNYIYLLYFRELCENIDTAVTSVWLLWSYSQQPVSLALYKRLETGGNS